MATEHKNINSIRTILLISINKELTSLRKSCTTKIDSRKLNEFEALFSSSYDNIIQLKEESFIPENHSRDVIQEKKARTKFHLQSPDAQQFKFSRKLYQSSKIIPNLLPNNNEENETNLNETIYSRKIFGRKSISSKKLNYFKMKIKEQIPIGIKIFY